MMDCVSYINQRAMFRNAGCRLLVKRKFERRDFSRIEPWTVYEIIIEVERMIHAKHKEIKHVYQISDW